MTFACLSLLSDYGASSEFVGVCHGVALRIAPESPIIDVCHTISPQNVREGAFVLEHSIPYLPIGVHVAIVDPGVGGSRRPVAIATPDGRVLVGPDNGLLQWAVRSCGGPDQAVVLDNELLWLMPRSTTFDGRDVFVPVAAHLYLGKALSEVGSPINPETLLCLDPPLLRRIDDSTLEVEALRLDRFGNITTSATRNELVELGVMEGDDLEIAVGRSSYRVRLGSHYDEVGAGELLALLDSSGFLALSVNRQAADEKLGVGAGDSLIVRRI